MNFKPTSLKIIISLVIGVVGGFLYSFLRMRIISRVLGVREGFLHSFFTMEIGIRHTILPWVYSGVIIAVVIYLIWSFIQKKK